VKQKYDPIDATVGRVAAKQCKLVNPKLPIVAAYAIPEAFEILQGFAKRGDRDPLCKQARLVVEKAMRAP
jgi:hypothetical protein